MRIGSSFRDGGHKVSDEEAHELDLLETTEISREVARVIGEIGSTLNLIPNVEASANPWGLRAGVTFGGSNLGNFFGVLSLIPQRVADLTEHETPWLEGWRHSLAASRTGRPSARQQPAS